jgi:hypothetical protein
MATGKSNVKLKKISKKRVKKAHAKVKKRRAY